MQESFELSADEMRKFGYAIVDSIIDHRTNIRHKKVSNQKRHEELLPHLGEDIPLEGTDPLELLAHLNKYVFSQIMHTDHPRFYSFIPAPSNFIGVMADTLAAGYNVFAGHWLASSAAGEIEMMCVDWLRKLYDFPDSASGIFVSGGSMANLMAVATARKMKLGREDAKGIIYYSKQTHSSVAKGLRVLGFGAQDMRPIETDDQLRLDLHALKKQLKQDLEAGLTPFCLIANAGTTNAGAIDPLAELAEIAATYNLWLHVDGAYGAAAVITDMGKKMLRGIELADSITLDPHKWWFQPFEIGCLLVRHRVHLQKTFSVTAEYLEDTKNDREQEITYYEHGIQLTRSFRALKFYMSLKIYGLNLFKAAILKGIEMAEYVEQQISKKQNFRIITSAQLGILNFQYAPEGIGEEQINQLSKKIAEKIMDDGYSLTLTTKIRDKTVLRMCPIHPELEKREIDQSIQQIETFGQEALQEIEHQQTTS